MDNRIPTIGHLSALDVAGRVIKYSKDGGQTWRFGRLLGGDSAVDTVASGMAIIIACEAKSPEHRTILTTADFQGGMIVMQATTEEVRGKTWWS